jgi:RHS repeat-associated protein
MLSGSVTFVYDGDGRRVKKISNNGIINYFYDGSAVILETDGNGNILKSYNSGLSVKDQNGNKYFFLRDGRWNVAGLMDSKQGIVQSYFYDVFGSAKGIQKDTNHLRFIGLLNVYSDDDIGLQYMSNRWYDPTLGRFVSRDPKGFSGGSCNLYEYSGNNPIIFGDPTGLDSFNLQNYLFANQTLIGQLEDINTWKVAITFVGFGEGLVLCPTALFGEAVPWTGVEGVGAWGGASAMLQNSYLITGQWGVGAGLEYLGGSISCGFESYLTTGLGISGTYDLMKDIKSDFQLDSVSTDDSIMKTNFSGDVLKTAVGQEMDLVQMIEGGFMNPEADVSVAIDVIQDVLTFF